MPFRPIFGFFSPLLILVCAALGQAPAKLVVASSPVAGPEAALPEAPTAHTFLRAPETALIRPGIRPRSGPTHQFFDRTNLWLHLGAVAAQTADLITTREVLQAGGSEGNPLARPLVHRGLAGQMAATYGLGEGAPLLAAYILHRTGHHRLERIVPVCTFVIEGLATTSNLRTRGKMPR